MSESQQSERDKVVAARFQSIAARFGDRFDAAAEEKIRNDLGRLVDAADALRSVPLANGDEPDFIFHATREES